MACQEKIFADPCQVEYIVTYEGIWGECYLGSEEVVGDYRTKKIVMKILQPN